MTVCEKPEKRGRCFHPQSPFLYIVFVSCQGCSVTKLGNAGNRLPWLTKKLSSSRANCSRIGIFLASVKVACAWYYASGCIYL